ncbi:DUF1579 domain-containing protein [Singulisphaera sp. Ch08]|uniref:DUF1579 domain-containing protein n=1 Tax=Singulisphaera sp. Ch08 TaxID=3120278 RepID=A0AAU7CCB2_9BACT
MLRNAILGTVICLSAASLSFGQEFPKPGPEHEKLKELEGTWDAVMAMGSEKSKATATYKSICGGMWMESDFQGDLGGFKFQGHGLDGYNQKKKKYVGVWVDSLETAPLHFEGDYDPKTKLMVMTGESIDADGKTQKFKNTTETKDKDHFTFRMYMIKPDGNEQLSFTVEYTRRK